MDIIANDYPEKINLDNCAKEPIHIIGKTQAHGVILACDPLTLEIKQAGTNVAKFFGVDHASLLESSLNDLLGEAQVEQLKQNIVQKEDFLPVEVEVNSMKFVMVAHFSDLSLVLDFEPVRDERDQLFLQKQLTRILNKFRNIGSIRETCDLAAGLAKEIFGYDRVMIYKFDAEWNGEVIAEKKEEEMESWLGLHYPATDIPAQSRALFLKHPVRTIADVNYTPVNIGPEISPLTGEPLDISRSGLRAVSPIHIEYLQNMKVGGTLSAAIIVNGKLWGLIACHHRTAKILDHYQREGCRFLSQVLAAELTLQQNNNYIHNLKISEEKRKLLLQQMQNHESIITALVDDQLKFTDLISCSGGAIFEEEEWFFCGSVPEKEEMYALFQNFLKDQENNLFSTSNLSAEFSPAEAYKEKASGVLSLRISENRYMIWFRPEELQTVTWGGNPHNKAFYNEQEQRLSPRKSFEKWTQALSGRSKSWEESDLKVVANFREDVSHFILAKQRRSIEQLNAKLLSANHELELFSYGLSHDLRAPVRGIQGYLQILEEDQAATLNEEGRQVLRMTQELTIRTNDLIDDILEYSRVNNSEELNFTEVNVNALVEEILKLFNVKMSYPLTEVIVPRDLPAMYGDRRMLFQLWSNLLNNALKYSAAEKSPVVQIGFEREDEKNIYFVKDNGIGIKPQFKEKIFETFSRVAGSNFKGSGIGLAIVKKIIEKHGGEIWVESSFGEGSVFHFHGR